MRAIKTDDEAFRSPAISAFSQPWAFAQPQFRQHCRTSNFDIYCVQVYSSLSSPPSPRTMDNGPPPQLARQSTENPDISSSLLPPPLGSPGNIPSPSQKQQGRFLLSSIILSEPYRIVPCYHEVYHLSTPYSTATPEITFFLGS
jgi:hypothetical protein